jgi:UDP-N-acetylglucosamine/UDP-N-acetylgalactosamine 4-epimerase
MELLCHQAAIGSVPRSIEDPLTTNDVNVGGFVNICFAAREAGIRRIVYASSSSVYGDDPTLPKVEHRTGRLLSPYAASKLANEVYAAVFAEVYGLEMAGLRYFNVFGPRQDPNGPYAAVVPRFIARMVAGEAVNIDGDGKQSRDFTYIANAVQANLKALTVSEIPKGHVAVNVAAGEETTINDLFNHIAFLLEYPHEARHGSPRPGTSATRWPTCAWPTGYSTTSLR